MDVGFRLAPCIAVRHSDVAGENVRWLTAKGELNKPLFQDMSSPLERCTNTYDMSEEPLKPFQTQLESLSYSQTNFI